MPAPSSAPGRSSASGRRTRRARRAGSARRRRRRPRGGPARTPAAGGRGRGRAGRSAGGRGRAGGTARRAPARGRRAPPRPSRGPAAWPSSSSASASASASRAAAARLQLGLLAQRAGPPRRPRAAGARPPPRPWRGSPPRSRGPPAGCAPSPRRAAGWPSRRRARPAAVGDGASAHRPQLALEEALALLQPGQLGGDHAQEVAHLLLVEPAPRRPEGGVGTAAGEDGSGARRRWPSPQRRWADTRDGGNRASRAAGSPPSRSQRGERLVDRRRPG